jgi:hypothetical protein
MTEKQIYELRKETLAKLLEKILRFEITKGDNYFEHLKTLSKQELAAIAYVASLKEFDEFLTQFGAKNVPIN